MFFVVTKADTFYLCFMHCIVLTTINQ